MQMKNHLWLGISRTNKGFLEALVLVFWGTAALIMLKGRVLND